MISKCSHCDKRTTSLNYKFCPRCGSQRLYLEFDDLIKLHAYHCKDCESVFGW